MMGSRLCTRAPASPGHQAGAPLRLGDAADGDGQVARFPRPSGRGSIAAIGTSTPSGHALSLPPAIRPGLHCGAGSLISHGSSALTSPGHQAGAPLRRGSGRRDEGPRSVVFPRPSGRGSIAAGRRGSLCQWWTDFPRPSGRGSIAATATVQRWRSRWPPSPGHQAGAPLRPHSARTHRTFPAPPSPGHQAGAPLRRARAALVR